MTVVLTGDVHQWINSADRPFARETETALALEYARIAGRYGLKVTLFFTGLAIVEDEANVRTILDEGNVEVGGHGWDSFVPEWRYRAANRLFASPHGSRTMQARMVRRTCATIERVTTQEVRSWRNHAYTFDANTARVLAEAGISVWSDEVDRGRMGPYVHSSGVTVLPINTTPDHEHLYHGGQTIDTVPAARRPGYVHPDAWRARIAQQVQSIVDQRGTATIMAHPLCMKVADDWETFKDLCARLRSYPSAWAQEAASAEPDVLRAGRTQQPD